jgi:hypothetical protein
MLRRSAMVCSGRLALWPMLSIFLVGVSAPACATELRTNLPYSDGQEFNTLDAYLKYLADRGPIGVPFYREVAPGQFERQLQVQRPGEKTQRLTRAELAKRYGFQVAP